MKNCSLNYFFTFLLLTPTTAATIPALYYNYGSKEFLSPYKKQTYGNQDSFIARGQTDSRLTNIEPNCLSVAPIRHSGVLQPEEK